MRRARAGTMRGALATALAVLGLSGAAGAQPGPGDRLLVRTGSGWARGESRDGIDAWRGLPYAAAPVGTLRWRAPRPARPWPGVLAAVAFGPVCPQNAPRDGSVRQGPQSEDCLTLNIQAPAGRGPAPLPVLVWLHGGGFGVGSGSAPLYDAPGLARRGLIVVTVNYRLGRLGFFAHPALAATARAEGVNFGLQDQIAALRWVRANIARFGGDPGRVTLAGASAGGVSVNALMAAPEARGLFHRAIVQSGLGREQPITLREAQAQGAAFARGLGVQGRDARTARALRALPVQDLVGPAGSDPNALLLEGGAPILDGRLIREPVLAAYRGGRTARVPLLIGANDLELPEAFAPASLTRRMARTASSQAALAQAYPTAAEARARRLGDLVFTEPARAIALAQSRRAPVFLYRFEKVSANAPVPLQGAPHGSEVAYVFGAFAAADWPPDAADPAVAEAMQTYWAAFAAGGTPEGVTVRGRSQGAGAPPWPPVSDGAIMRLTAGGPIPGPDPWAARLDGLGAVQDSAAPLLTVGAPLARSRR